MDMLLGNSEGTLHAFRNIARPGEPADFDVSEYNFQGIDAGHYSSPQLFDLDGDGLQDLVIGKRNGTISYYKNNGTSTSPEFSFITDSLGQVNVRNANLSVFGYCTPHFFADDDGKIYLFAGSEFGEIFYYTGINNNLDGEFKLVMKNYLWIDEGLRSAVAIRNLNADDFPEMIVGNYSGGLSYFDGTPAPPAGFGEQKITGDFILFPNPATSFLSIQTFHPENFGNLNITIFDIMGRKMAGFKSVQLKKNIDISQLKPGIYFVKICETSNISMVKPGILKFIKQ
jgi:hypothetical protein